MNVAAISDSEERTIVVESDLYRVEFANRGAVVKSWQLKKYMDDSKPQRVLDVVHPQASQQLGAWPFSLMLDDANLQNAANTGLYKLTSDTAMQPGVAIKAPADITFEWSDGHLDITKQFHFENSYVVTTTTTAKLNGSPILAGLAWRGGFGDLTVTNPVPVETVMVYSSENGKLTSLPYKKLDDLEKWGSSWQGGKAFAGIEDRYFTATFLPPANSLSTPLETRYWRSWHPIRWMANKKRRPFRKWRRRARTGRWTCASMWVRRTTTI